MNKDASKNKAIIYGLSTEGYRIASSLTIRGMKVSLVDEATRMAITLKPEIASSYPNVSSLMDDEPLLELEPIDIAIKDASFLFFAPKIRKIGQEARADSVIKLRDAMRALDKNCSVVYCLPTGIGGNSENIALIEHVTGLSVNRHFDYYYMPLTTGILSEELLIGSMNSGDGSEISKVMNHPDLFKKLNVIDITSAEFVHAIKVLNFYSGTASILEIFKQARYSKISEGIGGNFTDVFLDDISNGLFDLRAISSSLTGAGPLMYLVNGTIKATESYIKYMIDRIRDILKNRDLKASRIKVVVAWGLDLNEMRGDKIELMYALESKLKDYIGDVELQYGPRIELYPSDKTMIIIACSRKDLENIKVKSSHVSDSLIVQADPACRVVE
ncbi:MAG: hypothetical protein ACRD42_02715 [Nitrososphaeraceae archaeon]